MASRPHIWKEAGLGHPYSVHLNGREYGWFAWPEHAAAVARDPREAAYDATTGMIIICKKLTPEEQRQIEIEAAL
jgi:hypothetical protein